MTVHRSGAVTPRGFCAPSCAAPDDWGVRHAKRTCSHSGSGGAPPLVHTPPEQEFSAETLAAVISYAFERRALPELTRLTDVPNVASDRFVRGAGRAAFSEVTGLKYRMHMYRVSANVTPLPADAAPLG